MYIFTFLSCTCKHEMCENKWGLVVRLGLGIELHLVRQR